MCLSKALVLKTFSAKLLACRMNSDSMMLLIVKGKNIFVFHPGQRLQTDRELFILQGVLLKPLIVFKLLHG
jgi:hypothetical protein